MFNLGELKSCRVCESPNTETFFDLGKHPPSNALLKSLGDKENFYPLALNYCHNCGLVQLNYIVDPKELFSHYVWVTGTSKTTLDYAQKFYRELTTRTEIPGGGYVLEIASNDGTFLKPFIQQGGYRVLGVDPAENIAAMAEKDGVPTKAIFWSKETAEELLKEKRPADVVFARNVLPHVANTRDFVEGLALSLSENGTLAIEVHYAPIILEELHYDSIYHEHLCYFTFKTLEKLLNDFDMHVFDITESPISGGSIVVYVKKQKAEEKPIVGEYRTKENENKTNEFSTWQDFKKRSFSHKEKWVEFLNQANHRGDKIVGWGASARSSTLLNFAGVDSKSIPIIADMNPLKHKHFTPGTHILIDAPEIVMAGKPDFVVILAWNFAKEIMEMLKNKYNFQGQCLIPLPGEARVLKIS